MATLERTVAAPGVPLVHLYGILDQAGVRGVERAFLEAVNDALKPAAPTVPPNQVDPDAPDAASRPLLIANLMGVSALSTSGISLLLGAHRTMDGAGGRFILVGTSGHCSDVLRRCRLDTVFRVAADVPSALMAHIS